ncbi:MAG: histidinol-phosphate transaminase [Acidobacteriota bacterium]
MSRSSQAMLDDVLATVRPAVRELRAYHLDLSPCRFKLDQNEVPWDLPRRIKERALERLKAVDWAIYPDFHGDRLRRALGERHRWPWQGVLVGNGSNELLSAAIKTFARPGGEVLGTAPTFSLYRVFSLAMGATFRACGPRFDLRLPLAELEAEVARDPRRPVVLCSPNNPTGDSASPQRVAALLENLAAPLLLDNAYGEFGPHDYRPLLDRYPHLLIFRTFSKAWSLGGLRLGYVLARPELTAELIKLKLPYNLGLAGLEIACAALEEAPALERRVRVLVGRRRQWAACLESHGLTPLPSDANFLLVRCGAAVETIFRGLGERGIRVRDVTKYPGLEDCLRVSIGDGRALRAVDQALGEILAKAPTAVGSPPGRL